jgi:transcriptional antiterminator NusG
MKYYIVQAYSGFENKVKASLQERIRNNGLEKYFGEILVPVGEVTRRATASSARRAGSSTRATSSSRWR